MQWKTCAVTGHRPCFFPFGEREQDPRCQAIKRAMAAQFELLYGQGVRRFYTGGAQGVDLWAGELLLRLKAQAGYEELELVTVLPFAAHGEDWDEPTRRRLERLKAHSAKQVIAGEGDCPQSYRRRNEYLVDQGDCLLAVYDWTKALPGGTGQTVAYAKGLERPICFIHPEGGGVCRWRWP